jgi:hypothetical protein
MAALTPTSTDISYFGNKICIIGTFSAAQDADTWSPGFSKVEGAFITNGANDVDTGATYSGGVITVQTAGALANVKIMAIGV